MSPSPEQLEYAQVLLRRAKGDLRACRVLADEVDIDDSVVGFHGQQCVEKALKAALVLADVEIPRTHDLELLVEEVNEAGTATPDDIAGVEWLTPWAAEFRYDEPAALNRAAVLVVAERAVGWAASLVDAQTEVNDPEDDGGLRTDASPESSG